MTFTSPAFLPFVLAAAAATFLFRPRLRWLPLLLASYFFYATWGAPYLLLVLAGLTLVAWGVGIALERTPDGRRRATWLVLGTSLGLAALVALRYLPFLAENVNQVARLLGLGSRAPVPAALPAVGVSYYTLQVLSYLLDVRYGVTAAERHVGRLALHLAFFPKLLQGPIERGPALLPQLLAPAWPGTAGAVAGVRLFLWGLFQKVVVADRLAPFVDTAYGDLPRQSAAAILVATYLFAAQLYFDFAGYTDMALGVARLFGIRLTQNFDSPYLSRSIAEFWRRWHVSLSSWLLDYLFRPLQLVLRDWRTWGTPVALFVTFLVSGVWHGPSWTFVAWGLLHGLYLAASVLYRPWQTKLHRALGLKGSPLLAPLQTAVTFHLVCLSWIFFRAPSLGAAAHAIGRLASGLPADLAGLATRRAPASPIDMGQGRGALLFAVGLLALSAALRAYLRRAGVTQDVRPRALPPVFGGAWAMTVVYAGIVYMIAFLGTATQSFLYQRF